MSRDLLFEIGGEGLPSSYVPPALAQREPAVRSVLQWRRPSVPCIESLRASQPFWQIRTVAGTGMLAGIVLLVIALFKTARGTSAEAGAPAGLPVEG